MEGYSDILLNVCKNVGIAVNIVQAEYMRNRTLGYCGKYASVFRVIKFRKLYWAAYVARMVEGRSASKTIFDLVKI